MTHLIDSSIVEVLGATGDNSTSVRQQSFYLKIPKSSVHDIWVMLFRTLSLQI